jgi:hypothetical protein
MASPLEWLGQGAHALGQGVGQVVGLPFQFLGGMLGQGQPQTGGWKHPERQALAYSYVPDALSQEDKAQRMETFRLVPIHNWPSLIKQFQRQDMEASKLYASPEYQALYQDAGPQAVQQRYPGVPLPPQRQITLKDYPPLDDLDQAIAKVGGTESVPLPLPIQAKGGPQFPPVAPGDAVKYETSRRQLGAMSRPGAEGDYAADILAKIPPSIATNQELLGKLGPILQQAQGSGFVPELSLSPNGYTIDLKNPQGSARASGIGSRQAEYSPLGGGGGGGGAPRGEPVGGYLGPQQRPDGKVSTELLIGISDERLNGGKETNIPLLVPGQTGVDRLLAGEKPNDNQVGHAIEFAAEQARQGVSFPSFDSPEAATDAARGRSAQGGALNSSLTGEPPMRGQPSLSLGNYPDATAADFKLLEKKQQNDLQLGYEEEKAAIEAKAKGRELNEGERTKLSKIAAARSFLNVFERYGLEGQKGDGATESFPSALPAERISGMKAAGQIIRQSGPVQKIAREPFYQGLKRYQSIARPIIARNLGDDTGNLSETEQAAASAMTEAASQPEIRDAVAQMRAIIDEREAALLAGKSEQKPPGNAPGVKTRTLRSGKTILVEP